MPLIKYTQTDFDKLKRGEDGYIHAPVGDWSEVDFGGTDKLRIADCSILGNDCELGDECVLGRYCWLGDECVLGDDCVLGYGCALGYGCVLGNRSKIGSYCRIGNACKLGKLCWLGDRCVLYHDCVLGNDCRLGDECMLGDECVLGDNCVLGDRCHLGRLCSLEGRRVPNAAYFIVTNIGSRNDDAYAYCNTATGEIYVRAGCWFGSIDEFVERVHEVHAGTQHETDYIAFAEFARARFGRYGK